MGDPSNFLDTLRSVTTIYVHLVGEGVDVWRPVEAEPMGAGNFRVLTEQPADERWEFGAGDLVRCEMQTLASGGPPSGRPYLVAVARTVGGVRPLK
jgi:hypothetical protein